MWLCRYVSMAGLLRDDYVSGGERPFQGVFMRVKQDTRTVRVILLFWVVVCCGKSDANNVGVMCDWRVVWWVVGVPARLSVGQRVDVCVVPCEPAVAACACLHWHSTQTERVGAPVERARSDARAAALDAKRQAIAEASAHMERAEIEPRRYHQASQLPFSFSRRRKHSGGARR